MRQIRINVSSCKSEIFSRGLLLQEDRPRLISKRQLRPKYVCGAQGRDQDEQSGYDLAMARLSSVEQKDQSLGNESVSGASKSMHSSSNNENIVNIVFGISCVVSMMAAVSRSSFSLLVIEIQQQLGLKMQDVGALQSSLLLGYMLGQMPSGVLADRMGGIHVLVLGMILWSVFLVGMGLTHLVQPFAFVALMVLRFAVGITQSVLMPGVSATAAQVFGASERGNKTATVYAFYSFGTVVGLSVSPYISRYIGWSGTFSLCGTVGILLGVASWLALGTRHGQGIRDSHRFTITESRVKDISGLYMDVSSTLRRNGPLLLLLCWTHGSWIPFLLHACMHRNPGENELNMIGLWSSLPWLLTALIASLSGALSEYLETRKGWQSLRIRRVMQISSSLGAFVFLCPLVVYVEYITSFAAVSLLSLAVACQGFSYPGFHSIGICKLFDVTRKSLEMKTVNCRSSNAQTLPLFRSSMHFFTWNSRVSYHGTDCTVPKHYAVQGLDMQTNLHPKLASYSCQRRSIVANAGKIRQVNEEELEVEIVNRDRPLVIDFFATWCGPCLMLQKELEQVAEALGDSVTILKIDCDKNEAISSALQIQGLPTLIFVGMDPSKPALRTEGLLPAQSIIDIVQTELQAPSAESQA
eukprot:jgi/Picsp_1/3437/NSC_06275-R1_protein